MPTVPETKFFAVAPSLKSVFDNTDGSFSLFGSTSVEASHQSMTDDDDGDGDTKITGKLLGQVNVCC